MSDIFNHACDAFDCDGFDGFSSRRSGRKSSYVEFEYNPLYYHWKIQIHKLLEVREKAIRIEWQAVSTTTAKDPILTLWLPRSILRRFDQSSAEVYVHREIFYSIVRKAMEGI
jgi:hypothetical protein